MYAIILIVATAIPGQTPKTETPPEPATTASKPADPAKDKVKASTPEEAFQTFLLAMVTKDEATLREVTLPNDDFDWLLKGESMPPAQVEAFKAQLVTLPIERLKAGDEFMLPGKRKITIPATDVTEDRAVLVPLGAPVPTRVRKLDGKWKIDPMPIISGRKAADAARKKAEKPKP